MSCMPQMYNCTLTWIIENFTVFLNQTGGDFCVPEAEVETFNNVKWILGLRKKYSHLTFSISKPVVDASEHHQTVVDFMVSVIGTDGSLHFSKAENGVKFGNNMTQVRNDLIQVDKFMEDFDFFLPKDVLTIRIDMRLGDLNPLVLCSTVRTKIKIENLSFTWCLKSSFALAGVSFPIAVHLDGSPNFSLTVSLIESELSFSTLLLKLHKHSGYEERRLASGEDQAITAEDCDILVLWNIPALNSQDSLQRISECLFFKSSKIDETKTLPGNVSWCSDPPSEIQLRCEFSFADGKYGTLLEQLDYSYPSCQANVHAVSGKSVLGRSLFEEQKFVDVTLKAGNRSFKAHKAVLSSVSPVFNAMFDHDMKEQSTGVVCIEDMEPSTLESLLMFMYSNSLDDNIGFEKLASMFAAADKYQIYSLKSQCSVRLVSMMHARNLCRVLYLAYLHEDEGMKTAAKSLFGENPIEVLDSKEWANFMKNSIRGVTVKPSASNSFETVRQLRRSLSQIGRRISSSKIFPFHNRG